MTATNTENENLRELELLGELSELKRHLPEGIKPELFARAQELYPILAKAINRSSKFDPDERSLLQANLMLRQLELAVGAPLLYPEPLLFSVLVLAGESLRDLRDIEEEARFKAELSAR